MYRPLQANTLLQCQLQQLRTITEIILDNEALVTAPSADNDCFSLRGF